MCDGKLDDSVRFSLVQFLQSYILHQCALVLVATPQHRLLKRGKDEK